MICIQIPLHVILNLHELIYELCEQMGENAIISRAQTREREIRFASPKFNCNGTKAIKDVLHSRHKASE